MPPPPDPHRPGLPLGLWAGALALLTLAFLAAVTA